MADIIDKANERAEEILSDALRDSRKPEGPRAIGECHNCGEPLNDGLRFCDADCRDDWEIRTGARNAKI